MMRVGALRASVGVLVAALFIFSGATAGAASRTSPSPTIDVVKEFIDVAKEVSVAVRAAKTNEVAHRQLRKLLDASGQLSLRVMPSGEDSRLDAAADVLQRQAKTVTRITNEFDMTTLDDGPPSPDAKATFLVQLEQVIDRSQLAYDDMIAVARESHGLVKRLLTPVLIGTLALAGAVLLWAYKARDATEQLTSYRRIVGWGSCAPLLGLGITHLALAFVDTNHAIGYVVYGPVGLGLLLFGLLLGGYRAAKRESAPRQDVYTPPPLM